MNAKNPKKKIIKLKIEVTSSRISQVEIFAGGPSSFLNWVCEKKKKKVFFILEPNFP